MTTLRPVNRAKIKSTPPNRCSWHPANPSVSGFNLHTQPIAIVGYKARYHLCRYCCGFGILPVSKARVYR